MNLLKPLFQIFDSWRDAFCKEEAFIRAKELAICSDAGRAGIYHSGGQGLRTPH